MITYHEQQKRTVLPYPAAKVLHENTIFFQSSVRQSTLESHWGRVVEATLVILSKSNVFSLPSHGKSECEFHCFVARFPFWRKKKTAIFSLEVTFFVTSALKVKKAKSLWKHVKSGEYDRET